MGQRWNEMTEPLSLEEYAGVRPTPRPTRPSDSWVQLPQNPEAGEPGSGYYVYGTDDTGRNGTAANGQWGEPRTMQVITSAASRLANGQYETPFGVGNISLQSGGPFKGHKGHKDGLSIDVRPPRLDKKETRVDYLDPKYDKAGTQRLVDALWASGGVEKIYFNGPGLLGVTPDRPGVKIHDNHLHIKIKP